MHISQENDDCLVYGRSETNDGASWELSSPPSSSDAVSSVLRFLFLMFCAFETTELLATEEPSPRRSRLLAYGAKSQSQ
jgi:hypothetical protein